jgi:hypothetical protein
VRIGGLRSSTQKEGRVIWSLQRNTEGLPARVMHREKRGTGTGFGTVFPAPFFRLKNRCLSPFFPKPRKCRGKAKTNTMFPQSPAILEGDTDGIDEPPR